MRSILRISIAALVALLLATPLFAGTVSYDTQSAFLAALSSSSTVNFDSNTPGVLVSGDGSSTATLDGITFSGNVNLSGGNHGNISVVSADDTFFDTTSGKNGLGSDDPSGAFFGSDNVTMQLGSGVTAFGLYVVGGFPADTFTLSIGSGSAENTDTTFIFSGPNGGGAANYIGITSDTSFSSITITETNPSSDPNDGPLWNIDDLTYGNASGIIVPPSVPEPASLLLLGSGLALFVRRLKRA
jgi:hypothetical protein